MEMRQETLLWHCGRRGMDWIEIDMKNVIQEGLKSEAECCSQSSTRAYACIGAHQMININAKKDERPAISLKHCLISCL